MTRRSTRLQHKISASDAKKQLTSEQKPKDSSNYCLSSKISSVSSQEIFETSIHDENLHENFSDSECLSDIITDDDMDKLAEKCANQILSKINDNYSESKSISEKVDMKCNVFPQKESSNDDLPTRIDISGIEEVCAMTLNDTPNENIENCTSLLHSKVNKIMKQSVISPDFEARPLEATKSRRSLKKDRRQVKMSSTGNKWFNMKAPEMTEDVKRDLEILQMRSVLDPKRFYKHNDKKSLPKYFQIGKIMDNSADFYSSRIPRKKRKQTLAEELLADAEFKRYQKKKFNQLMSKRKALGMKKSKKKRPKLSL